VTTSTSAFRCCWSAGLQAEAELVRWEVVVEGRDALIVFGGMHFPWQRLFYPVSDRDFAQFMFNHPDSVSTVSHLEAAGIAVFSIRAQARDDEMLFRPRSGRKQQHRSAIDNERIEAATPWRFCFSLVTCDRLNERGCGDEQTDQGAVRRCGARLGVHGVPGLLASIRG
jgi:hypothetical protein